MQATAIVAVLSLVFLPVQALVLPSNLAGIPAGTIAFHAAYQGLLVLILGVLIWSYGVKVVGTETASRFSSLVPVAALGFAALGDGTATAVAPDAEFPQVYRPVARSWTGPSATTPVLTVPGVSPAPASPTVAEVATTAGVAGACRRAGVLDTAIDLAPPGIEPVAGSGLSRGQVAARLGLRPDTVWTLCVAPLEPSTHVDRLLWAIDQLGVVHKGLEHVVVGAGPLLARVRRRARLQHCAERLFVFPSLDCLPDLLPRVRLVWQPGEVADAGCLLDGMAHGVAAVAVESDAAAGIVADDQSGRIVAADPISEFPRRALGIIEDDSLAARYGSAARARAVAEFPVARSTAALLASIERALTLNPGRG
jgi:hypothetical protein